jgi:penicillin-binding protein 2
MSLFHIFVNKNKKKIKEIDPEDIFLESTNLSNFDQDNFEGRFEKLIEKKLFYLIGISLVLVFSFFAYKASLIQVKDYEKWSNLADKNYLKKTPIFPSRGVIKDRNGEPLVWNEDISNSTNTIPNRFYAKDLGISSLLGYVSYPKKDKSGHFWQDDYIGSAGLEKKYNDILSGSNGEKVIEINANGTIAKDNILNKAIDGENVETNIDARLQKIFYNRLRDVVEAQGFDGGAAVMMDVNTGEVLSLVSVPDFDSNIYANATNTEDKIIKNKYLEDVRTPMLNRVINGSYVPGSVVKPFMAYAALYEGVIGEYDNIYSSGQLVIKNKYGGPDTIFRDWKAHGYVDARKAIAQSSDEYFYQIGGGYMDQKGLGINKIEKYMKFFGFASSTGIDFPSEKIGVVPSIEWKKKNFAEGDWLLGNTYHTSIGQYGFKTTPLELVRSIALIANGGKIVIPKIVNTKSETEEENQKSAQIDLSLDQKILKIVQEGMRGSAGESGTAHYFSDLPFKVNAKTGTAQLGFNNERVNSWSSGYWPSENPKYAFVFMMEDGPASNKVASSKVMRQVFGDILELAPEYTK